MKRLKKEYQKLNDDFIEYTDRNSCSCHINPPCDVCIHEGNPDNLAENVNAWENDSIKTVSVRYSRSLAEYTFMTDQECKAGDKAVVFTNGNWNVVTIVEIHDELRLDNSNIQYTFLVQIVDRTNYDRLVQEMHEGGAKGTSRL